MKQNKYLITLIIICFTFYLMMWNIGYAVRAEDIIALNDTTNKIITKRFSQMDNMVQVYLEQQNLIRYIKELTKLKDDECYYLVRQAKNNKMNPFIFLGVMKTESDFNPYAVGLSGERGLGQLMENTAKPVAQNLGYTYEPEKLFDAKFNLELTITQLNYLYNVYNKDINKALTAYNRGQQGLEDYIKQGRSIYLDPAMSDYSVKVLNFANTFKEEFENFNK